MLRLGIIGIGHWGPNLLRNFHEHPDVELRIVCDNDQDKQAKLGRYNIGFTGDYRDVLSDSLIDAVVIATPLSTHYEIAKAALLSGKHVFIEKPLASTLSHCAELLKLSVERELVLMVGHVFLYNNAIRYVKECIDSGELGNIMFIHGQRTNLGPVRRDANALWDLASHDVSIFNYWLGRMPESVSAVGSALLDPDIEDVVSATFCYEGGVKCNILASWLHPCKTRLITVVGDKRMLVWDDMSVAEPVRIYDKSIKRAKVVEQVEGTIEEFRMFVQDGEMRIPRIDAGEPLKAECGHFIRCLLNGERPLTDGRNGLEVVAALEAAMASMRIGSKLVEIGSLDGEK